MGYSMSLEMIEPCELSQQTLLVLGSDSIPLLFGFSRHFPAAHVRLSGVWPTAETILLVAVAT